LGPGEAAGEQVGLHSPDGSGNHCYHQSNWLASPARNSEKSIRSPCAKEAQSDALRLALRFCAFPARNAVDISKAKALDLTFNLMPLMRRPLKYNIIAVLKMNPQFTVT
jgi:hypothetical protein